MKTDKQIYTLLSADPDFLRLLTDGIAVRGAYQFEALSVKGLERHTDGVLIPRATTEGIWVIEFQAQHDPLIYHRLLTEIALVGERHPTREVRGCLLFADATLDPRTEPWHGLIDVVQVRRVDPLGIGRNSHAAEVCGVNGGLVDVRRLIRRDEHGGARNARVRGPQERVDERAQDLVSRDRAECGREVLR